MGMFSDEWVNMFARKVLRDGCSKNEFKRAIEAFQRGVKIESYSNAKGIAPECILDFNDGIRGQSRSATKKGDAAEVYEDLLKVEQGVYLGLGFLTGLLKDHP